MDGYRFSLGLVARTAPDTQSPLRCPKCHTVKSPKRRCRICRGPRGMWAAFDREIKALVDQTVPVVVFGFMNGFEKGLDTPYKPGFFERVARQIRIWKGGK